MAAAVGLARLHGAAGEHDPAIGVLEKSLKASPKSAALWHELGMARSRKKDWTGALDALAKADELESDNRQYATYHGFALARVGRPRSQTTWSSMWPPRS